MSIKDRVERLENARGLDDGVQYVIRSSPVGEPEDNRPMTPEEWAAKYCDPEKNEGPLGRGLRRMK